MQAIQIVKGATAPADAQVYTFTQEGQAIGNITGWEMLLDPNYVNIAAKTVLNRCKYKSTAVCDGTTVVNIGQFANTQKAFETTDTNQTRLNPNIPFPADNWSVVFVAKPTVKTDSNMNTIVTANTGSPTDVDKYRPKIGFTPSTNNLAIMLGSALAQNETRLTYASPTPLSNETAVYIVTGSSKNGLAIYKNGVKVASSTTDNAKKLLNDQIGAGEWHVLRGARGLFGYVGLLSIDLNDNANKGFRDQINQFLMSKYGVV
ncbi:hypothetical protein [uncultured Acinetobacter sp.]|uniref:hypothetical protein n=1 Tax=uncultured Acinetobacter sp. TaxID=165433 RepID=UPI003749A108|nr:hypothetical protein PX669_05685 [Acinetobacter soli]